MKTGLGQTPANCATNATEKSASALIAAQKLAIIGSLEFIFRGIILGGHFFLGVMIVCYQINSSINDQRTVVQQQLQGYQLLREM